MAGFFRKVAGAFVYLDDPPKSSEGEGRNLDDLAREAGELAAQLGGSSDAQLAQSTNGAPSVFDMTANQVFASAGLADGPNSAQRVLKIISGLNMFPREQQLVMVRAMDAADETWSEAEVMSDAELRQAALRAHAQAVELDRSQRLESIAAWAEKAQADGRQNLADIDQRIAALQKTRDETAQATASTLQGCEAERVQVEAATARARRGIATVSGALSDLITFFRGGG